jgi:hypothetical protein
MEQGYVGGMIIVICDKPDGQDGDFYATRPQHDGELRRRDTGRLM